MKHSLARSRGGTGNAKMKVRIGNVELDVVIEGRFEAIRADAIEKVIGAAVKDLAYRPVANKLFPSGKDKKGFKRDDKWSEALGEAAKVAMKAALEGLFEKDSITVSAGAYVAPEKAVAVSPEDMLALASGTLTMEQFTAKYKVVGAVASEEPGAEAQITPEVGEVDDSVE